MSMFSVRTLYYRVSYLKFNQPTIATKQNKHAWMECAALCAAEAQIFQWFAGIVLSCHRFLWKVRGKLHEVRNDLWHDLPQHDHRVWEKTESRWYDQTCPSVWIWICHLLRDKVIKSYLVWDETTSFPFYDIIKFGSIELQNISWLPARQSGSARPDAVFWLSHFRKIHIRNNQRTTDDCIERCFAHRQALL